MKNDVFDFGFEEEISDEQAKSVADIAIRLKNKQKDVQTLEEALAKAKEDLKRLEEIDLPDAMDSIGMKDFTLSSGEKISVKDTIAASIKGENKEPAYLWLVNNGHGDLIKTEIKTQLGRGEFEKAQKICESLKQSFGIIAQATQSVHYQTLSAWAREQLEAGVNIPKDLLGVFIGRKATIKQK
jgi:hypothetical protein